MFKIVYICFSVTDILLFNHHKIKDTIFNQEAHICDLFFIFITFLLI